MKGQHSGSRCPHPRPGQPTPCNPTSSVHPQCPQNLLPHCPVLLPVATQSTGLFLGISSDSPPRMAPKSAAGPVDFSCPLNPVFRIHSGPFLHSFTFIQPSPQIQKSRYQPCAQTQGSGVQDPGLLPQTQASFLRPRTSGPSPLPSDSGVQPQPSSLRHKECRPLPQILT